MKELINEVLNFISFFQNSFANNLLERIWNIRKFIENYDTEQENSVFGRDRFEWMKKIVFILPSILMKN